MNRSWLAVRMFVGALLLAFGCSAHAFWIGLQPASSTHPVNGDFTVDLVVSGLVTDGLILSTYDLTVAFDALELKYINASESGALGVGSLFVATPYAGSVNLFELSDLTDAALAAVQSDSFTLATMSFRGIGAGTSLLDLVSLDALGGAQEETAPDSGVFDTQDLLAMEPTVSPASVTITASAVPEPGTLALAALTLGLLPVARRTLRPR